MNNFFNIFLVGRPNVGKSSIFNFLISSKEAFVKNEEGTTIDWRSKKLGNIVLWDTPGAFNFEALPVQADFVYFVIDNIVLDVDKKFYLELKKHFKNILVIINKIDRGEDVNYSFFENYIKISLFSRFNVFQLKSLFLDHYVDISVSEKKTWAIVGKPNVGKSSFINALLNFDLHKVEDSEGTTKEFLPVEFDENVLLDTPGQRHRAVFPRYSNVFGLVVMTDLNREKQDLKMINLAISRKKPVILVLNKIDLIQKQQDLKLMFDYFNRFFTIPIISTSCLKNSGLKKVLNFMNVMESNYNKRISTGVLNNWLIQNIKPIEPKVKFITQVETGYPKFYLNCSLTTDKEVMLKKRLSKQFGFDGIPIKIIYK